MSFSKKIKNNVKKAVAYIGDFEQNAAEIAIERGYDYVICGHIHNPQKRYIHHQDKEGKVLYLNSGDWIEHLSALEYSNKEWKIFTYEKNGLKPAEEEVPQFAASSDLVSNILAASDAVILKKEFH